MRALCDECNLTFTYMTRMLIGATCSGRGHYMQRHIVVTNYDWEVKYITLLSTFLTLVIPSVSMQVNAQDSMHDLYRTADGRYDWCLFCHDNDLQLSIHFQRQCVEQNPDLLQEHYDTDSHPDVLWCFDRGKPPTCAMVSLPNNTEWKVSDASHPNYTHTNATLYCKTGFVRHPLGEPQNVTLNCLSTRQWHTSIPKNFQCVPEEKIPPNVTGPENNVESMSTALIALSTVGGLIVFVVLVVAVVLIVRRCHSVAAVPPSSSSEDPFLKPNDQKDLEEKQTPCPTPGRLDSPLEAVWLLSAEDRSAEGSISGTSTHSSSDSQTIPKEVVMIPQGNSSDDSTNSPDRCTSYLSELETHDDVYRAIVKRLDPDSDYGDRSWVALAKAEGYSRIDIIYIKHKKGTDMFDGTTDYVIREMIGHDRRVGHLVKVLDSIQCCHLIQKILSWHDNCQYCRQFVTS